MTRTIRLGFALVIAGALGACSGLIPDQDISNAFGLDGVPVTATAGGADMMALDAGPSGSSEVTGSFGAEIRSGGFAAIPGFIGVASISDVITIAAAVDVSAGGEMAFAAAYTITDASIVLSVSNDDGTLFDQAWSASGLDLTFSGSATYDPGSDTTTGTYTVVSEVPLVTLVLQGAAVDAFVGALSDGDTLDVAGTIELEVQPAFPFGAELTFTLKSLGGTLTF